MAKSCAKGRYRPFGIPGTTAKKCCPAPRGTTLFRGSQRTTANKTHLCFVGDIALLNTIFIPNIVLNAADYRVDMAVAISYNTLRKVSDYMTTVGNRLKDLRHSVRLSQKAFAPKVGLTQSAINRYENNQAEASYKTLIAYADYFDVSLDYIYGRTDKPQGKLYEFKPRIEDNDDMRLFIEMCFDPKSPMSGKLKDTLLQMMKGG